MATKKKGLLTASGEWAKHLRPWGKRAFWKAERKTADEEIRKEQEQWPWTDSGIEE